MGKNVVINTIPENDKYRVEALARYRILDTPPEQSFDNIAKLATQLFDVPISLITFVDTAHVFLKSHVGLDGTQTTAPRSSSLCSLALLTDEVTIFDNIPKMDPCLLADPVLLSEMGFQFYAGAPLITPDGFRIGTLCVMGMNPRSFSERDARLLTCLSRIAMDEIEMRLKTIVETECNELKQQEANDILKKANEELEAANKEIQATFDELARSHEQLKKKLG